MQYQPVMGDGDQFFRNVLQVDGLGNLGVAPDIDLAAGIDAAAVGRAGRDTPAE